MPTYPLFDPADNNDMPDDFYLTAVDLPGGVLPGEPAWYLSRSTLREGRSAGVESIELHNGFLAFTIIPTRGMGLHRGMYYAARIGWDSPVRDGPVNPAFIRLEDRGGLGWLDGFDELMVRCGLAHNGPPFETVAADGRRTMHPLHGRIANIPASQVRLRVDDGPDGRTLAVAGEVAESALFHPQLVLATEYRTTPGSRRLTVRDVVTNRSDQPGEFQLLYHWNLGPPFLGAGSRVHAPIEALCPRDARAAEGVADWSTCAGPTPGFAEQAYLARLVGDGPGGKTLAMLVDPTATRAVVLRFQVDQLPCFTFWKNTGGVNDGYVVGLEPATNLPHPKAFEAARGRVVPLDPGATYVAETTLEVLDTADAVNAAIAEVDRLQATRPATIHPRPVEPFAPAG